MKTRRIEKFCSEFESKMMTESISDVISEMCYNYFDDLDVEM